MDRVVVVGAGFAGLWSAVAVVREMGLAGRDVDVVVIAPTDDMVVRPRLYEADPAGTDKRVPLDKVFGPVGVRRIAATATGLDVAAHTVTALDRQGRTVVEPYDKLVVAAGSVVVRPDVAGAEQLFDVDTMEGAARLEAHLQEVARTGGDLTVVVVGAGFTGLELATEMPSRLRAMAPGGTHRVVLLDRGEQLARPLGDGPRPAIAAALRRHGVEVRQAAGLAAVEDGEAVLTTGERIPAGAVVWTAGMRAADFAAAVPAEHDRLGRLEVDEHLRVVGVDDVYATGDCASARADPEHQTMQACQHAVPLGKHCGYNVAADLLGRPAAVFSPEMYVTCLALGPGEAIYSEGWEREVKQEGVEGGRTKHQITHEWIVPPVDDRDEILRLGDHRITWPFEA